MSRMLRAGAVAALGALILSGCAPTEPSAGPSPSASSSSASPQGADRSADEVRAASAAIDPCALLDGDVASQVGASAPPAAGLFTCTIENSVLVSVFVPFTEDDRAEQEKTVIGGAVAYRTDAARQSCDIALPTSPDTAIVFDQHEYGAPYDCTETEAFAAAAAETLLDDPAALRRPDGGDGVIACEVFEALYDTAPSGTQFAPKTLAGGWGLDSCGLWKEPDPAGFQAVEPESSLWLVRRAPLSVWSAQGGWEKYDKRQIAGREVLVMPHDDDQCDLFLDAWPSRENDAEVIGAVVTAADCAASEALVAELVPLLDDARPASAPNTPLLYAEGEPDSAGSAG